MSENEQGLDLPEFDQTEKTETPASEAVTPPPAQVDDEEVKIAANLAPVFDVPINISAVLGKTELDVNELLQLSAGTVLELDRKVGEAIDIYVNSRLVARGEVVVVDERLGVTMTEIIKADDSGK
ncbi:Flagellar motor switch protein FliN [hydrothermal vent metagenome]|uniref:Flagellar motor switch protein FliN n=1 Tax=hydrothermal vent metagenome TaxID=652676 RepID=A0A3B0RVS7_9ZZZZ